MNRRNFILGISGMLSVTAGAYLLRRDEPGPYQTFPISSEERTRTLFHMRPPKRKRPVIAVLADNRGSETTDFIIPWSVLTRSDIADVYTVALEQNPVQLMPALSITPELTTEAFSAKFPGGADYVIVPAFHHDKSPLALSWIKQQRATNASIIGICAGALPLAYAGLLDGRRATTHWYSIKKLKRISPLAIWEKDRRYVADEGIITTTGVSASLPLSLTLVEAIANRETSDELATRLGVQTYDARHNSEYFKLEPSFLYRIATNTLNIPGHEKIGVNISDDVDELSLALTADAWSRTYRSKVYTIGASKTVRSLNGLEIHSDFQKGTDQKFAMFQPISNDPGTALVGALNHMRDRYGASTAANVALQLEYPWNNQMHSG